MPADFDKCLKEGGKIVTIKPKKGVYLRVCYDKKDKPHAGEVHYIKSSGDSQGYEDFLNGKGEIFTLRPTEGVYVHVCKSGAGDLYPGKVHHVDSRKKVSSYVNQIKYSDWRARVNQYFLRERLPIPGIDWEIYYRLDISPEETIQKFFKDLGDVDKSLDDIGDLSPIESEKEYKDRLIILVASSDELNLE